MIYTFQQTLIQQSDDAYYMGLEKRRQMKKKREENKKEEPLESLRGDWSNSGELTEMQAK